MIWHPEPGQVVRLHYAKRARPMTPLHGRVGIVRIVARGPGPRNVGVEIDAALYVVPRGNLVVQPEKTSAEKPRLKGADRR